MSSFISKKLLVGTRVETVSVGLVRCYKGLEVILRRREIDGPRSWCSLVYEKVIETMVWL